MININQHMDFNIIIVGLGGTGSHLISFLSQLLGNNELFKRRHKVTLIDGDIVEEKNLRTQKFLASDVGRNKAEVLAERYQAVFDMDMFYVDKYITLEDDLDTLVSVTDINIIVSCVDNNKARKIIDDYFNKSKRFDYFENPKVIYIDTGNSSGEEELTGQTVVGYRKGSTVIMPSVSTYFPQMLQEEIEPEPVASCGEEMTRNIQNIGANITSACTVFNMLNSIIAFRKIPGDLFMFNASRIETESLKVNMG